MGKLIKQVYSNELLTINGSIIPHDYPIFINEGWTFLGYLHQNCYSALDMMSTISNDINILKIRMECFGYG